MTAPAPLRANTLRSPWLWGILLCLCVGAFCLAQDEGGEVSTPASPEPSAQETPSEPAPADTPEPPPSEPDSPPEQPSGDGESEGGTETTPETPDPPPEPGTPGESPEPPAEAGDEGEPEGAGTPETPEAPVAAIESDANGEDPPDREATPATEGAGAPPVESAPGAAETLDEEKPAEPAVAARQTPRWVPPPRPVSREAEQRRDEAVVETIEMLAAPGAEEPLSTAERMSALSELALQARVQFNALETERSQWAAELRAALDRGAELVDERRRLPGLVRSGRLPPLNAENARMKADETSADMGTLFDTGLARRAELEKARARYERELARARELAEELGDPELAEAWEEAIGILEDRQESTTTLVGSLNDLIKQAADAGDAAAGLSVDLEDAIKVSEPRRLTSRGAPPVSAQTLAEIQEEAAGLALEAHAALVEADATLRRANLWVVGALTLLALGLAVTAWLALAGVPCRLIARCREPEGASQRQVRAAQLLVPGGRAVVLAILWVLLVRIWGLYGGWALLGLALVGAWTGYYLLNYALQELLAPDAPEARLLDIGDSAATHGHGILRALALYTAILYPMIQLLGALQSHPAQTIRVLQIIYGAGLLAIGAIMIRRAGGLAEVLPQRRKPDASAPQQAGRWLVPLLAAGVLAGVIAAATGYTNLSEYLSRTLALELLMVVAVLFVDHLLLRTVDEDDSEREVAWRTWARRGLWLLAVLVQIPILKLQGHHGAYVVELLKRSIINVQGAEVTPLSIFKGLLFILGAYVVGRLVRARLQGWDGLMRRFQAGAVYAVSNLIFYLILAAGLVWGILASGFQLSVLTVFAGMAGIGLGFGLQDIVGNFVSGLILLIERPAAVGDFVDIGDLRGEITAINLRSTSIRTRDGNLVLVPNSDLAVSRLTNFTISDPKLRLHIAVGVSYDTDLSTVHEILMRCAHEHEGVLEDPAPLIRLMDFGSSSVDFELLIWVPNPDVMEDVSPQLRKLIWDAFADAGIEIPFPQTDLHIRSSDIPLAGLPEAPPGDEGEDA